MTGSRHLFVRNPATHPHCHRELGIDELLREPIVRLLMAADGVDAAALRTALEQNATRHGA